MLSNASVDFSDADGIGLVEELVDRLKDRQNELPLADIRSVATPLGITGAEDRALEGLSTAQSVVTRGTIRHRATQYYVSTAADSKNQVTRLDLVLKSDP